MSKKCDVCKQPALNNASRYCTFHDLNRPEPILLPTDPNWFQKLMAEVDAELERRYPEMDIEAFKRAEQEAAARDSWRLVVETERMLNPHLP